MSDKETSWDYIVSSMSELLTFWGPGANSPYKVSVDRNSLGMTQTGNLIFLTKTNKIPTEKIFHIMLLSVETSVVTSNFWSPERKRGKRPVVLSKDN